MHASKCAVCAYHIFSRTSIKLSKHARIITNASEQKLSETFILLLNSTTFNLIAYNDQFLNRICYICPFMDVFEIYSWSLTQL